LNIGKLPRFFADADRTPEQEDVLKQLKSSSTLLGRVFIEDATKLDAISKLSRYETALVGMLNTVLRQLDEERKRRDCTPPSGEVVQLKAFPDDE